jgi:hypothetical protein
MHAARVMALAFRVGGTDFEPRPRVGWFLVFVVVPAILAALVVAVGTTMPPRYIRARRARFARPSHEVWRTLSDLDAHHRWRTNVVRVERLGPARFREHYKHGALTYAIDVDDAPVRRVHRIVEDAGMPFGGRWIFELCADGDDTHVTVTEEGLIHNPGLRVFSSLLRAAAIDQFLGDLARHLHLTITVEPAQPSPLVA